jgi:hypothetical protein
VHCSTSLVRAELYEGVMLAVMARTAAKVEREQAERREAA